MPSKVLEMTTEEKNEMKKIENIEKDIENTGRWWELWESEEAKEYFAQIGCENVIRVAISELKKIFTAECYKAWIDKRRKALNAEKFESRVCDTERCFKLRDYDHPLISSLLFHAPTQFDKKIAEHPFPINFFIITPVTLGLAVKESGGAEILSKNAIKDLQSARDFLDRYYETVMRAFFKNSYRNVIFEEDLLDKGRKKPDVKIENVMYAEIKNLNVSDYEKDIQKEIEKKITGAMKKKSKNFKGSVGYSIHFDQINPDLKEVIKAIETAEKLIESLEVKPGETISKREGGVSLKLNFTPDNTEELSGTIIGLGHPEMKDIYRIYRILTTPKVLEKNPGDLPMILVISPSSPITSIKDETYRENISAELFESATSKDKRVKSIRELWIDTTSLTLNYNEVKRKLSDPISSLSRSFIKIRNPFYEELSRSVDL